MASGEAANSGHPLPASGEYPLASTELLIGSTHPSSGQSYASRGP